MTGPGAGPRRSVKRICPSSAANEKIKTRRQPPRRGTSSSIPAARRSRRRRRPAQAAVRRSGGRRRHAGRDPRPHRQPGHRRQQPEALRDARLRRQAVAGEAVVHQLPRRPHQGLRPRADASRWRRTAPPEGRAKNRRVELVARHLGIGRHAVDRDARARHLLAQPRRSTRATALAHGRLLGGWRAALVGVLALQDAAHAARSLAAPWASCGGTTGWGPSCSSP